MGHNALSKSTRFLLIASVFAFLFNFAAGPIEAGRPVRIGAERNLPVASVDDDGKGEGLLMDIAGYVANKEGWTLAYVPCELDRCLSMLKNR